MQELTCYFPADPRDSCKNQTVGKSQVQKCGWTERALGCYYQNFSALKWRGGTESQFWSLWRGNLWAHSQVSEQKQPVLISTFFLSFSFSAGVSRNGNLFFFLFRSVLLWLWLWLCWKARRREMLQSELKIASSVLPHTLECLECLF